MRKSKERLIYSLGISFILHMSPPVCDWGLIGWICDDRQSLGVSLCNTSLGQALKQTERLPLANVIP